MDALEILNDFDDHIAKLEEDLCNLRVSLDRFAEALQVEAESGTEEENPRESSSWVFLPFGRRVSAPPDNGSRRVM